MMILTTEMSIRKIELKPELGQNCLQMYVPVSNNVSTSAGKASQYNRIHGFILHITDFE